MEARRWPIALAALVLASCAAATPAAINRATSEAEQAMAACEAQRASGQLKSYVEAANCSNPQITAAFQRISYPYMDIIQTFTTTRVVIAERADQHLITGAEAAAQEAMLQMLLTQEAERRFANKAAADNAQAEANLRALAIGAALMQQSGPSRLPPGAYTLSPAPVFTNCSQLGNSVNCVSQQ
jgi:hypothetical protein